MGMMRSNLEPLLLLVSSVSVPPNRSAIMRAIDSPSPVPCAKLSSLENLSKMYSFLSGQVVVLAVDCQGDASLSGKLGGIVEQLFQD